jgi:hypothetical protein
MVEWEFESMAGGKACNKWLWEIEWCAQILGDKIYHPICICK